MRVPVGFTLGSAALHALVRDVGRLPPRVRRAMRVRPFPDRGVGATLNAALLGRPASGVDISTVTLPGAVGPRRGRVHRPAGVGPHAPVVLHFHGGGHVIGAPTYFDWFCSRLARDLRAVLVSVDYRKAPEHPAPAPVEDAIAAARWLWSGEGKQVLQASGPIVTAGDSAGGNLAALVAIAARDEGVTDLVAQLLVYPWLDITLSSASAQLDHPPLLTRSKLVNFRDTYLGVGRGTSMAADDPRISPMHVDDLTGVAPAWIVLAQHDHFVDEGHRYAARLRAAGVEAEAIEFPGVPHGFASAPALTPYARQSIVELAAFAARKVDAAAGVRPPHTPSASSSLA